MAHGGGRITRQSTGTHGRAIKRPMAMIAGWCGVQVFLSEWGYFSASSTGPIGMYISGRTEDGSNGATIIRTGGWNGGTTRITVAERLIGVRLCAAASQSQTAFKATAEASGADLPRPQRPLESMRIGKPNLRQDPPQQRSGSSLRLQGQPQQPQQAESLPLPD